jgi:hypothetical protein
MEQQQKDLSKKTGLGWIFFSLGLGVALAFGWGVFPTLLYSQKIQPLNFSHASHQDSSCEDCHTFRADGTYTGIPKIEKCKECHEDPVGSTEAERILIEEYIKQDKEIPWLVYARQPDNVYFTHASHVGKGMECVNCHHDVNREGKDFKLPPVKVNRLTGYTTGTMLMVDCEKCHAERGTTNSCNICHK